VKKIEKEEFICDDIISSSKKNDVDVSAALLVFFFSHCNAI
jgi:hypothetical protein